MAKLPKEEEIDKPIPPRPETVDAAYEFLRLYAKVTQEWAGDMDIVKITMKACDGDADEAQYKRQFEMVPGDARQNAAAKVLLHGRGCHAFLKSLTDGEELFTEEADEE